MDTLTQAYRIAPNLRRAKQNSRTKIRSALMGDADMGFHWFVVENEAGRQPVIRYKRRNVVRKRLISLLA